jgi:hypothetical protein
MSMSTRLASIVLASVLLSSVASAQSAEPAAAPDSSTAPPAAVPAPPPTPEEAVAPAAPPPAPPPPRRRPPRPPEEEEDEAEVEEPPAPVVKVERPRGWIPPRQRGVLVLPFVGFHTVQGIAADDYDFGARFGFLLGAHVTSKVSLNVEAAWDILRVNSSNSSDVSAHDLTIAFSPLFHVGGRSAELVVGPKLGYWSDNFTVTQGREVGRLSQSGWTFGANAGVFFPANENLSLGALVTYQFISPVSACTYGPSEFERECGVTGLFPPEILGFTAAALF